MRGHFKTAASLLLPVLYEADLAPHPHMFNLVLHEAEPCDAEAICKLRASWVERMSLQPMHSTEFLHTKDAVTVSGESLYSLSADHTSDIYQDVILGAFETNNYVPWILDLTLFHHPNSLGHKYPQIFENGIPDEVIALAGAAAVHTLHEYRSGYYQGVKFAAEVYATCHAQLQTLIANLKSTEMEARRRLQRLSANLSKRGQCVKSASLS